MSAPTFKQTLTYALTFCLVLGASNPAVADSSADSLAAAYKKEFAYLESQKKALEDRLEELDERRANKLDQARSEVDRLEARLLRLQDENDRLEERLVDARREADTGDEGRQSVATTLEQANATFEKWGRSIEVPDEDEETAIAGAVDQLFSTGAVLIEEHHSVRRDSGEFFLTDGSRAEGDIVHVGNVATFGVAEEAAGALAPAGDGRLKLWKEDAAETARALANGEAPETLQAFLFESLDEAVQEREEKTWLDIVNSGGVIAWVIVGLGILGLLLVLLRAILLLRAGASNRGLMADVGQLVYTGDIERAQRRCEEASGATSRVLAHTLSHIDVDRAELEDVVDESILRELPTIERFGSAILVFAAVAPLLGLLGTVTGMISTFDIITEFGTGDPKLLSGGISEALVTTQLGLIVAIPLLLLGNLLKGWANSIIDEMQRGALRLMNLARLAHGHGPMQTDGMPDELPEDERDVTEYLGVV